MINGKIGFIVSKVKNCTCEEELLLSRGFAKVETPQDIKKHKIGTLIVLGGDGAMLRFLHKFLNCSLDFYGVNLGTNGFLMNSLKYFHETDIVELIKKAKKYTINPLKAKITSGCVKKTTYAINEVSMLRATHGTAHLKIFINGEERLSKLVGDGMLVSAPAGSTAYNISLNGPILPLDSNLVSMMPISPFFPRLWRGGLVKDDKIIKIEVLDYEVRKVNATADFHEFENVQMVEVSVDKTKKINLLFNAFENIEEKIINQQFVIN